MFQMFDIELKTDLENPAERLRIYEILLDKFCLKQSYSGFCYSILSFFGFTVLGDLTFKQRLPELFAQKPKVTYDESFWFRLQKVGKDEKRIECLKKAIELIKKKYPELC